jgi:hypothetical protein
MDLHICEIRVGGSDERGEWVCIVNDGTHSVQISGLLLSDFTPTQKHAHVYELPTYTDGTSITLGPGERAFVFTRSVKVGWVAHGSSRALILSMGKEAPIWNNSGDVAYLRNNDGTFIDTMTVGNPARHPGAN